MLARSLPGYRAREVQVQMAQAIADTISSGGRLVVEAGTGIGKTFGYLVPALLSQQRVLLSTATKALQDQLVERDVPRLLQALGLVRRVAKLKGRSSYLCLHRMEQAQGDSRLAELSLQRDWIRVRHWALHTESGDLSELADLPDHSPLLPAVTSTRENCLGAACPQAARCHVNKARRTAMQAEVLIVNHHVFFADVQVRETGVAELLPAMPVVVFDEAHQLNDIGVQFAGQRLSSGQLESLAADMMQRTQEQARGFAAWPQLSAGLVIAAQALRHGAANLGAQQRRIDGAELAHAGAIGQRWAAALAQALQALSDAHQALQSCQEVSAEMVTLTQRAAALQERVHRLQSPPPEGRVRWLEMERQVQVVDSALDVGPMLQSLWMQSAGSAHQQAWIFTSATLGQGRNLDWFIRSHALEDARIVQLPSPFDYANQAACYVPPDFPGVHDPRHPLAVAMQVYQGAVVLGGRTLVLCTTLRSMREIGSQLRAMLPVAGAPEVLVQGEASKSALLQRYVQAHRRPGVSHGAILVAAASFWEGIDLPGNILQLLVIDKLPFAPPDDPLLQARSRDLLAQGLQPFRDLQLPQTAIALRQGVGRLIRSEMDQGIVVLCDLRLLQKPYGRNLLAALPPMRRLKQAAYYVQALDELRTLTTASTTETCEPPGL